MSRGLGAADATRPELRRLQSQSIAPSPAAALAREQPVCAAGEGKEDQEEMEEEKEEVDARSRRTGVIGSRKPLRMCPVSIFLS